MKRIAQSVFLLALLSAGGFSFGQFGWNALMLDDRMVSQAYQPANILEGEFETIRLQTEGNGWLGNSGAPIKGLLLKNYIEREDRERFVGDLGKDGTAITGGYKLNWLSANVHLGESTWSFFLEDHLTINGQINNGETFGLVFLGNQPYAGQTVSDEGIFLNSYRYRTLGAGTAFQLNDEMSLGFRAKFIQGISYIDVEKLDYSLYTEPDGLEIVLDADYNLFYSDSGSNAFSFNGFGGGLDIGWVYKISDKLTLDAAVTDLGYLSWNGNQSQKVTNVQFEGIDVGSLFASDLSAETQRTVDSLEGLILPDTAEASHAGLLGPKVRIGAKFYVSEKSMLSFGALYAPMKDYAYTELPVVNIGYRFMPDEDIWLGANAYGGGNDLYGVGLVASYRLHMGSSSLDITAGADNLTGIAVSGFGRGFSLFGALGFNL